MSFLHGINVTEVTNRTRAITTVATAVIGLVGTAPDAVACAFPLDTAVKVTSLDEAITNAGATGTLRAALRAIAGQVRAPIVVARVAPDVTPTDTIGAIVGTDEAGVKTGMQALLTAPAQLDLHPRIIGAPGLEGELVIKGLVTVAKRLRARVYAAAIGDDPRVIIMARWSRRNRSTAYCAAYAGDCLVSSAPSQCRRRGMRGDRPSDQEA